MGEDGAARSPRASGARSSSPARTSAPVISAAPTSRRRRSSIMTATRAYRTGDWGRERDGLIFFEGRMDGQIKLNGYRIELGDLEANLRALPEIADAVVLPVEKDGRVDSLAAFVVLAGARDGRISKSPRASRRSLGERLPAYMIPRKFKFLDAFPMTPNGKADRRKLAEMLCGDPVDARPFSPYLRDPLR